MEREREREINTSTDMLATFGSSISPWCWLSLTVKLARAGHMNTTVGSREIQYM